MAQNSKQMVFTLTTTDGVVNEYFAQITRKDLPEILALFDDDAVVYEPFSKEKGLRGKEKIKHFLKVAFMANSGLKRTIEFEKITRDSATAFLTFERDGRANARFSFRFVTDLETGLKKIKELRIRFL